MYCTDFTIHIIIVIVGVLSAVTVFTACWKNSNQKIFSVVGYHFLYSVSIFLLGSCPGLQHYIVLKLARVSKSSFNP